MGAISSHQSIDIDFYVIPAGLDRNKCNGFIAQSSTNSRTPSKQIIILKNQSPLQMKIYTIYMLKIEF
jgi:hypothetical protein